MRQCKIKIFRPFFYLETRVWWRRMEEWRVSALLNLRGIKILPNSQIDNKKWMSARLLMLTKKFCNCSYAWIFVKILCCVAKALCIVETKIDVGNNVSCMAKPGNIGKTCIMPTINVSGNMFTRFVAVLLKLISQSSVPGGRVQVQAIFDPLGYMKLLY